MRNIWLGLTLLTGLGMVGCAVAPTSRDKEVRELSIDGNGHSNSFNFWRSPKTKLCYMFAYNIGIIQVPVEECNP